MQKWTPAHASFIGRIIFANFLNLPLKNYKSIIEEAEKEFAIFDLRFPISEGNRRKDGAITARRLSRTRTLNDEKENRSSAVVAKIERSGNRFVIRYTHNGFNKMYVIDKRGGEMSGADSAIRSTLFRLRRISSRNALTHRLLRGITEHQREYLKTGNPDDLAPLSQVQLPIDNSWTSRLVNRLSVITPFGEEKPLKWFFQTQKDINKRFIKQLLDKESEDLESGSLKKPYTDNELKALLEVLLREKYPERTGKLNANRISRHSIAHYRTDMGIPTAKRRLSGYKYPPLSANFSLLYPLVLEEVLKYTPSSPGIYEFRLRGKEIAYPDGKTQIIYIGSTKNIKKRLREHLGKNGKNGHIKNFLKNSGCSFRFIQFSNGWKEEEGRLYSLFVATYGTPPKCNRVRP